MLKKNQLYLSLIVLLGIIFILLAGDFLRKKQEVRPKAAREVGDIFLEPESGIYPPNSNFNAGVIVNIGSNKFNVGRIGLTFDKNLLNVENCLIGDDFESVAGIASCRFDNNTGTISVLLQAKNVGSGPTGSPILANLNFKVVGSIGERANVNITQHEIAVDTPSNETVDFVISNVYNASYQIGEASISNTPTPTNTLTPSIIPSATPSYGPFCQTLYNKIQTAYFSSCGDDKYDSVADIDKDQQVRSTDTALFRNNQYNESWCSGQLNEQTNPCSITPTVTVVPTPTRVPTAPLQGSIILNLKLKFQGVMSQRADQEVKVTVAGGADNLEKVFFPVRVTSNSNGVWTGTVPLSGVPAGNNYLVLVKGPKHLQRKYCDASPVPISELIDYHCGSIGRIALHEGINTLDLTRTTIYIGDLPPQDGLMNARDASEMRLNLTRRDSEALSRADVNFDGIVNTTDWSLLIESMQVRYDEER